MIRSTENSHDVTNFWEPLAARLADSLLARNVLDALFRGQGRRQVALLDRVDPARAQVRTLLGLVQRGRKTIFGLDHDFRRIRSAADFRRLVPVRQPPDLVRQYGSCSPGAPALQSAFRAALSTAFSFAVHAQPHARLLSGSVLVLDDRPSASARQGKALLARVPWPVRLYAHAACGPDRHGNDDPVGALAEVHARDPVTALIGPADKLLQLCDRVKRIRAVDRLERAWPGLQLVLYSAAGRAGMCEALRSELPPSTLTLEQFSLPVGPLALEDPRHGGLRLLADHGLYFEFLPLEKAGQPRRQRLGLEEVEVGKDYEIALTAPGDTWACRVGCVVTFTQLRPHLIQVRAAVPSVAALSTPHLRAPSLRG